MPKKILLASIDHIHKQPRAQVYDEQFIHALFIIWNTANQICSKRLVPFIPNLVSAIERHDHLRITQEIRDEFLKVSPVTVGRLLQNERRHPFRDEGNDESNLVS
jgi:hypothetical protein